MAKYQVTTDKGKYLVETESPQQTSQPQSPLDTTISQRPDIYNQAVKSIQQVGQQPMANPFNPMAKINEMGKAANIGLQSLGGIVQRGEAAIANPFLRKQGQFQNPLTAMKEGITGQRLGELGDVVRQSPLGGIPGLPEIAGLAGTGFIGGALARGVGLTSKANNLMKMESTYGKDISKGMIKFTTGLSDISVEHGAKRGWRNILTKENLNPEIPTKIADRVLNNLDDITTKEYDEFGKALSKVKTGNVKAIDLNQVIEDTLKQGGYLDEGYNPTLKSRGSVVNKIQSFVDSAQKNKLQPNDNIPIDVIQTFKKILKGFVPEKNWIGKTRSLKGEQRLAKELSNNLDNLIAYNSYGIEDQAYTQAKRNYSNFKNFEKAILDRFSTIEGQELKPTARNIIDLTTKNPTLANEEINTLRNIDSFLVSKGHQPVTDKLLDWNVVRDFTVKPRVGNLFEKTGEIGKGVVRQGLKTGIPTSMGNKGNMMNRVNPYTIPPSILRMITGRNDGQ